MDLNLIHCRRDLGRFQKLLQLRHIEIGNTDRTDLSAGNQTFHVLPGFRVIVRPFLIQDRLRLENEEMEGYTFPFG